MQKIIRCRECGTSITVDVRANFGVCDWCRHELRRNKETKYKPREKECGVHVIKDPDPLGFNPDAFFSIEDHNAMLRGYCYTPGTILRKGKFRLCVHDTEKGQKAKVLDG